MAIYRATRTSPYNNWQYRMDIMPYDEKLSGSVVTLDEGTIVAFGDLEHNFDDVLPYGLANPATWSVTVNFTRLPSALQTYLRAKSNQYSNLLFGTYEAYNTFMYWTDSGTNGATWSLLFVGVVENAEGAEYSVNDSGELETTYNLVDAAYHTMLQVTGNLEGFTPSSRTQDGGLIYDYYAITGRSQWRNEFGAAGNTDIATAHLKSWYEFSQDLQTRISGNIYLRATRSANTGIITNNYDYNLRMADMINTGVRLKGYNTDGSGNAFGDLTDATAFLLQYIVSGGEIKGGMYSTADEYGFSQAQCMKDILSDLCETLCVKMYWQPEYVVDGGGNYIRYNVEVATLLGNKRSDGAASAYDLTDAVSIDTLSEGAGVIGRGETRVALEGDDKNVTEFVTSSGRSRSERSINIEPILNNLPTPKTKQTQRVLSGITYKQRETIGIDQTNCIFSNDGAFSWGGLSYGYAKAHHDTRVVVRGGADGGAATTYYEANSSAKPTSAEEPAHLAWMNEVQRNAGIPKGLSKALFNAFSGDLQCELTVQWRVGSTTLPDQLGAVHNLQGGIASTLTQYAWDKACVTGVVHSFENGTSDIRYFLPSV